MKKKNILRFLSLLTVISCQQKPAIIRLPILKKFPKSTFIFIIILLISDI